MKAIPRERLRVAVTTAAARRLSFAQGLWKATLDVCRKTARNRSSMLQDLDRGRKTEIEALTGALLEAAERHGIDAPVNRTLFRLVRMLERRACREKGGRS